MDFFSRHLGTFSKNFVVHVPDATMGRRLKQIFITIRHNHLSGSRQVLVNGTPIPFTRGTTNLWMANDMIRFRTEDDQHDVKVLIVNDMLTNLREKWLYAVDIDGIEGTPVDAFRDQSQDSINPASPTSNSYDPSLNYTIRIAVSQHKISTDNFERKAIVEYKFVTTRTNIVDPDVDNEVAEVWYRFSEILELDGILKTSYKQSHLQASYPAFPPRCLDPRVMQTEEGFLRERRELLGNWARRICGLPRIGMNQDFLRFARLRQIGVPVVG